MDFPGSSQQREAGSSDPAAAGHLADLTSYLCYLIPLAATWGDRVYEIVAASLAEGGLEVTAGMLRDLARDLTAPGGEVRYRRARLRHAALYVTYC